MSIEMKQLLIGCFFGVLIMSTLSCEQGDGKDQADYDSLFLGFYLGMERQAFFDHCWDYTRGEIFTHGPNKTSVEYKMKDELDYPAVMRFYPTFENDRIYEMPVLFSYVAWAPWNRQFQSDSLLVEMVDLFKQWYGEDFEVMDHKTMGKVYYRIDKKRRINLFIKDEQHVQAVFTDLKVEKDLKEAANNNELR